MKRCFIIVAFILALAKSGYSEVRIGDTTTFTFATIEQGKKILTVRDDFIQRLSPFDRAARMKTDKDISEEEFLQFVASNALAWNDDEISMVESSLLSLKPRLEAIALPWPKTIYMIKTTGKEEGDSAYTRANAVIIPQSMLVSGMGKSLQKIISHELFHVLTRKNPALQEKLFAGIGFYKCKEIAYPPKLQAMKITNPDAPRNDYCINLQFADSSVWAVPILFSRSASYNVKQGGQFFDYLKFRLLVVTKDDTSVPSTLSYDQVDPQLVDLDQVSKFYEQVGKNTKYIIHPEEILADNFALLVQGEEKVKSPEVLKRMREILAESQGTQSITPVETTSRQ